ncbi:MAG: T9SS type A sorting domain-containing protein [Ignavibacteria bacterium]
MILRLGYLPILLIGFLCFSNLVAQNSGNKSIANTKQRITGADGINKIEAATDEGFDSITPQIMSTTDSTDFGGESNWSFFQSPSAQMTVAGVSNGSAFTNGLSQDYSGDNVLFFNYNNVANVDSFAFHPTDESNFKLVGFQLGSNIDGSNLSVTVSGYLNGSLVNSATFDLNSSSSSNGITYTYGGDSDGGSLQPYGTFTFDATYQNVDEVRLEYGGTATPLVENIDVDTPVPVELISFTAFTKENSVELNWETATEVNNYGFEIQKLELESQNMEWEKIGFVQGHGNSNSPKSYSFVEKSLNSGDYSYRLKQVDFDGAFEYSDVVNVFMGIPTKFSLEQNYPNPFNPETKIRYSIPLESRVTITLFNTLGEQIELLEDNIKTAGTYELNYDASNLSSGLYIYRMNAESTDGSKSFSKTNKMILLK